MQAVTLGIRDYMLKQRFSLAELLTRVRRHIAPSRSPHRQGEEIARPSLRPSVRPEKPDPPTSRAETQNQRQRLRSAMPPRTRDATIWATSLMKSASSA